MDNFTSREQEEDFRRFCLEADLERYQNPMWDDEEYLEYADAMVDVIKDRLAS